MRILFIGDVIGRPGRQYLATHLTGLRQELAVDFVVANAENTAGGVGATTATLREVGKAGVDAFTLGNHTWRKKEFISSIERVDNVVRPANFPPGVPGCGGRAVSLPDGRTVGLVSVVGRVYMEPFECPFLAADKELAKLRRETSIVLVDVHAEATSEKVALGRYLDGRCAAVVGTHTHVQTADERILPGGTAYITDVGMTGPFDSVIGVKPEAVIRRFLTGIPTKFEVAERRPGINAVVIEVDEASGRAISIERIARYSE